MCRNRKEIIEQEVDVQKLISLKRKLEAGEINGFNPERLYFEVEKLESELETKITNHKMMDKLDENKTGIDENKEAIDEHSETHKKNPSLIELFKKSPTGVLSFLGAFIVGSSLFYIKESRDLIVSLIGMSPLTGESISAIGFPLFIILITMGLVSIVNDS